MPRFFSEPDFRHDRPVKTGVLLINLGTPTAPTAAALKPYLRQFLSDPRVVEIPRWIWKPLLNGLIIPLRAKKSAAKYASIWRKEGSPLRYWTEVQTKLLKGYLGEALGAETLVVDFAMCYGEPSVQDRIAALKAAGCDRVLVVPLYPQYAASSTGAALDAVWRSLLATRFQPEIRVMRDFYDDPNYILALTAQVRRHWQLNGQGDHLLMSFHGVPRASLDQGDPYFCHCQKTGRLLARELGWPAEKITIAFQSRFGKAEWLKPYTSQMLVALAKQKIGTLDVICPGFVADCLETLEEIAIEGKETFLTHGGGTYRYIPCLNDSDALIASLGQGVLRHVEGWATRVNEDTKADAVQSRLRAQALGAKA